MSRIFLWLHALPCRPTGAVVWPSTHTGVTVLPLTLYQAGIRSPTLCEALPHGLDGWPFSLPRPWIFSDSVPECPWKSRWSEACSQGSCTLTPAELVPSGHCQALLLESSDRMASTGSTVPGLPELHPEQPGAWHWWPLIRNSLPQGPYTLRLLWQGHPSFC